MENATKALIIAAAILIAIVLISLGVFVLGQGSTMVKENSDMSAEQVTTYNAEWEAYLGDSVSGTRVKQLINAVNQHNRTAGDDSKIIVLESRGKTSEIFGIDTSSSTVYTDSNVSSVRLYRVVLDGSTGYTSGGLIKTINITMK